MQWSLVAVVHIVNAIFGASFASAEDGKGQISSVFEAFGYSPACVARALTSCEYSSTKKLSVDVVDATEVTKSLLQEMKSERENSASVVQTLLQEMKSEVQAVRQEMRSEVHVVRPKSDDENSLSVMHNLFQEMKLERENSVSVLKTILQEMKSERENSASVVQTLLQEKKSEVQAVRPNSEDENSLSVVNTLFKEMKSEISLSLSEVKAICQEMKSERENSTSVVQILFQGLKPEVQAVSQEMRSEIQAVRQEMKSEKDNSTSIVKSLLQEMKSEVQAVHQKMKLERENSKSIVKSLLQEMKSESENEKNSFEIVLGNLENITHRISTLEVILQKATSERKNVSHSLADMKTFLQEMKTEQENDFATRVNNSKNKFEPLDAIKAGVNIIIPRKNCADLRFLGDELSGGVQTVYPYSPNQKPVVVYCNQVTDGGGWTVIQSRSPLPVRENFTRNWNEYVQGFGDPKGEFWLGLNSIHALTNSAQMELRVDLEDAEGEKRFAKYRTFHVGDAASKYVLRIEGYSGDAGDAMIYPTNKNGNSNGMKFSTFDNDNDLSSGNCAKGKHGGWWFNACFRAHLNGRPIVGKVSVKFEGIHWIPFSNSSYSLKKANMKIRPVSLGF